MGKWFCVCALAIMGWSACNKERLGQQLEGSYQGTFHRSAPAVDYVIQNVTLHLNDNSFTGQSGNARYPAICHGSWEAGWNTVNFSNACAWTADFDWTLILDGEFEYEWDGTRLKIWKTMGDMTDVYELEKTH